MAYNILLLCGGDGAEHEISITSAKFIQEQLELTADFKKGTFIFALQKEEKGIPLVKLKDGQLYQPAFTDILEFQKFNRENKMRPVVVEAAKVPTVLANEAQGIILNVMGVNLPLTVSRPKVQAAEPKRTIPVPVEEINKALEK